MASVSESAALRRLRGVLRDIDEMISQGRIWEARASQVIDMVKEADRIAATLEMQASRGIHRNPPALVLFGNPPMRGPGRKIAVSSGRFELVGKMSDNVHEIRYTHADDEEPYKHIFESGNVEMWAIRRAGSQDVLITGGSRQPLWKDF